MRHNNVFVHIAIVVLGILMIIGIPFCATDYFKNMINGEGEEATSSATVVVDMPSGEYVVLINKDKHPDDNKLSSWVSFFKGEEVSYIMEDINCMAAEADEGALKTADSYISRLAENQMSLRVEESTFMLSKIRYNIFDTVIMSKEFYDVYVVDGDIGDNIEIVEVHSESDDSTDFAANAEGVADADNVAVGE